MALIRKSYSVLTLYLLLLLCVIVGSGYGYGPNPNIEKEFFPVVFRVQGIVYCKSASNVLPLKGGVMRITCLGIDKYGYETPPFSKLSRATDANGYFLAKISSQLLRDVGGVNITQCKVFLHSSRLKICPFATNFNNGLSGASLSAYRTFGSADMRLYSVGPFIYEGVMRITCLGIDKYGYETTPFSKLSRATDANGYFLAKISSQLLRDADDINITQCKVFLHSSRLKIYPFATNFNNGLSGTSLSAYRTFGSADLRLYSIGPFIYGSNPPLFQSTPFHCQLMRWF